MSKSVKTDIPNCEAETANRTPQIGSITLPADGCKFNSLKVEVLF